VLFLDIVNFFQNKKNKEFHSKTSNIKVKLIYKISYKRLLEINHLIFEHIKF